MQNDNIYYSKIDHFAVSSRLLETTLDAGVIHLGANSSNHSPIFMKFNVDKLDLGLEQHSVKKRSSWSKASDAEKETYKVELSQRLGQIPSYCCVSCQDVHYSKEIHRIGMESYTLDILEAMEEVGQECLPHNRNSKLKSCKISGWNEYIKPYANESKFWHQLWLSAGRPS